MANLGTLWFGADIDLTALRNKVLKGNESILNALKMDYDPASYQQMVSKIRTALDRETFEIKINSNAQSIRQNLQSTINSVSGGIKTPTMDLSGLKGIAGMRSQMASLTEEIILQEEKARLLKRAWKDMSSQYGRSSVQAQAAYRAYRDASESAKVMRTNSGLLGVDIRRASLAQAELNRQTKEAAKATREWNSDHMRLNATLAGGVHISTQLGSALSSLFAIDYARQFLGNVIEIGGQLEKQRISIGAILGDTVKASHLFEQIKGLALQSPFGVVELDQYTKQLSAYGFRYNELYDMTKRLADISAGAGTDIGRLTLALGHVRSATYLTGITLRQFSMNNIPMLKMLADYYTEVEKKAVSTAEVQQRISKRQVSYEDVIEQIRRLTDEGGMFYNMQEKISESLAARYKNLKDAMDIMYGEMAEGSVGDILKGLADILLKTTRHWKEIANVMGVAAAAFMLGKIRIGLSTVAMQGNTAATIKQIMATKQLEANNLKAAASYRELTLVEQGKIASSRRLTAQDISQAIATNQLTKDEVLNAIALKKVHAAEAQALVTTGLLTKAEVDAALATNAWSARLSVLGGKIKNAFAGIGWGTWGTIAAMVGMELYSAWDQWNQRIDDKSNEMKDLLKSRIIDLQKIQKELDSKPTDRTALKGRIDEMKQVLANSEEYTKTIDEQLSKTSDLSGQYDILAETIKNAAEENKRMLDYQDNAANMIKASSLGNVNGLFDHGFWDFPLLNYFFNDDINDNMTQTIDAYKDLRMVIDSAWEYKDAIKGVIEEMIKSGEISEEFAERLKKAPFEEQIRLLAESGHWDSIAQRLASSDEDFSKFAERIKEAANGVTKRWSEITYDDFPRMFKKLASIRGESEEETKKWALNNIDDFKMMMDGILDQLDVKEPYIRRKLKEIALNYVSFGNIFSSGDKSVTAEQYAQAYNDVLKTIGIDAEKLENFLSNKELATNKDENNTDPTKGDKKDKQLEAAKTKLQEYKAFLSEYKKYREVYSKEKAIDLLEQLFPNLKGQGENLVDNYVDMINKLRFSEKDMVESHKKFNNELSKLSADTSLDETKKKLKDNTDAMKEYTKKMEEQWKLYRSLLEKSGSNRDFAQFAFNDKGKIWDETAKEMLAKFNLRGNELGAIPIAFHWDMNEQELRDALVDAKGKVQEELVELAKEIQKVIRANYTKLLEDAAEAYKMANEYDVELGSIDTKYKRMRDAIKAYSNSSIEADRIIAALNKSEAKEISAVNWKRFKEENDFGRVFGNLDRVSLNTIKKMITAMKEYANTTEMSIEETKAWYEAMDKLTDRTAIIDPLNELTDALKDYNVAHEKRKAVEQNIDIIKNSPDLTDEQKQEIIIALEKDRDKLLNDEAAALTRVNKAVKTFSSSIRNLGSAISSLGDSIGGDFGNILSGFGGMLGDLSNGMEQMANFATNTQKGFAGTLSKVTAVVGLVSSMVSLNMKLDSMLPSTESIYEKRAEEQKKINQLRAAIDDYYVNSLKTQLKNENWLYNNGLSEIRQNAYVKNKLLESYVNALGEPQEIYKEARSGLSKWGPTIIGAIVGAIVGIVTYGGGSAAGVALGTAIASALGSAAVSTAIAGSIGAVVGTVLAAGASAAIGTAMRSIADSIFYANGQTSARQNLRVMTQTGSFWRGEKTENLEEWARKKYGKDLFDKDNYDLIDVEMAKSILESGVNLAGETRETLQKLIEVAEQIYDIQDQLHEYVSNMFSPLVDNMTDALWDWLSDGKDMLKSFEEYASDTFTNIAKDAVKSFLKINLLDKYQKKLEDIALAYSLGVYDEKAYGLAVASVAGEIKTSFEALEPALQVLAETLENAFEFQGFDITGSESSSSISNSIKSITEQTADLLASYVNGIRADVSVIRATQAIYLPTLSTDVHTMSVLSQTQVTLQQQVAANTLRNADAADRIYEIMHKIDTGVTKVRIA